MRLNTPHKNSNHCDQSENLYFTFSDLLRFLVVVIIVLLAFSIMVSINNTYVNKTSLLLGIFSCTLAYIYLSANKKLSNTLILLLLYCVFVYYLFRIFTLSVFNHSDVMDRFPFPYSMGRSAYTADDTNFAILFILFSTILLIVGFAAAKKYRIARNRDCVDSAFGDVRKLKKYADFLCILFAATIVANIFSLSQVIASYSRVLGVFTVLIQPGVILLPALVFFAFYKEYVGSKKILIFSFLILINITHSMTANGTRGDFVSLIELMFMVLLACDGFMVKKKNLYKILIFLPFLFFILVVNYKVATMQRVVHEHDETPKMERIVSNYYHVVANPKNMIKGLPHVFARAGFLDFSAETMANRHQYAHIFNINYYGRSIVDNLLTPGFDLYDTPKVGNALVFVHQNYNNKVPSKFFVNHSGLYHSDQIGIYGELYGLFALYSLPLFLIGSYFVGRIYFSPNVSSSDFRGALQRTIILYFCSRTFNSFGLDWSLSEFWPYLVSSGILFIIFKSIVIASHSSQNVKLKDTLSGLER